MRIEFKSKNDADGIQMAFGDIGVLSFKDKIFSIKVGNYTVQLTKVEMHRLSTIYGYTDASKPH